MKLNFTTGRLPLNFIILGYLLLALGVWRILLLDLAGIIFLILSVALLFIRSGVIIDTNKKLLKKYIGFLFIRNGDWEDIRQLINLEVVKKNEVQQMNVLSLSRVDSRIIFKLYLKMPDRDIELMAGSKNDVLNRADAIASALSVAITDNT